MIETIPCWSEPMDDERAYMELILGNQQRELSPLEIGLHALKNVFLGTPGRGKEGGLREYSRNIGVAQSHLTNYRQGAKVFITVENRYDDVSFFLKKADHLATIHKAPPSTPGWYHIEPPELANIALTDPSQYSIMTLRWSLVIPTAGTLMLVANL